MQCFSMFSPKLIKVTQDVCLTKGEGIDMW